MAQQLALDADPTGRPDDVRRPSEREDPVLSRVALEQLGEVRRGFVDGTGLDQEIRVQTE